MDGIRWFNPSQPQTIQGAVILSYFNAFFSLFSIGALARITGVPGAIIFLALIAQAGGAVGIASERRVGYMACIGGSAVMTLVDVLVVLDDGIFGLSLIGLMFSAALMTLLLHDQTRGYARIWFR